MQKKTLELKLGNSDRIEIESDGVIKLVKDEDLNKNPKKEAEILKENYKICFEKKMGWVNSYTDFIKIIEKDSSIETEKIYQCFIENHALIVTRRELSFQTRLFMVYEFENQQIENLMSDLLDLNSPSGSSVRALSANASNNYNFLVFAPVLETLLANEDLIAKGEIPFKKFKIKKKNGKFREIIAPNEAIKKPLRKLNKLLQNIYDGRNSDFQVAYKKGKNIADNASLHKEKKFMMCADLTDFFPSCKRGLVKKYLDFLFTSSFNSEIIEDKFLNCILENNGLFIGNPISGTIANAILSPAVNYMHNIAGLYGLSFSVYADDITFGSDKFLTKDFVTNIVSLAFKAYGLDDYFSLNPEKFHGHIGVRRHTVGLSINDSNKLTVPNVLYRELRAAIHNLSLGNTSKVGNLNRLRGKISFASAYDENGKVYRLLKKFESTVQKYSLCSQNTMDKMKEKIENA